MVLQFRSICIGLSLFVCTASTPLAGFRPCMNTTAIRYVDNTVIIPPNIDACFDGGTVPLLLSGIREDDARAQNLCVNLTKNGHDEGIVECVSKQYEYSRKNHKLEVYNGTWALNVTNGHNNVNQTTYSWWLVASESGIIADTSICLHAPTHGFQSYIETSPGKRVSVGYSLTETNAKDVSLVDDKENVVFSLDIVEGKISHCAMFMDSGVYVSLRDDVFVVEYTNVSCESDGSHEIRTTFTSDKFNTKDFHLHVKENVNVNISVLQAPEYEGGNAVLRCNITADNHFEVRGTKWFHNGNLVYSGQSELEYDIANFEKGNIGRYYCQVETMCRNYTSQTIAVVVERNISDAEGTCVCGDEGVLATQSISTTASTTETITSDKVSIGSPTEHNGCKGTYTPTAVIVCMTGVGVSTLLWGITVVCYYCTREKKSEKKAKYSAIGGNNPQSGPSD